jgi:hypothetical protein
MPTHSTIMELETGVLSCAVLEVVRIGLPGIEIGSRNQDMIGEAL